jgi:hypothetical protein
MLLEKCIQAPVFDAVESLHVLLQLGVVCWRQIKAVGLS